MKLYHGSSKYIENELVPHKSFHYKPLVYATSDYYYALVRAGKFDVNKLTFKEDYDGVTFTLIELTPNAFEEVFNTDGYIYEVDDSLFVHTNDLMPNEYICKENCKIVKTIHIENVGLEIEMRFPHINIIKYEEADDYWKTVRGGREGYLKRRRERVEKLKENKMACQLLEIEIELQHEYEEFIQTDEGQKWKKQWINELGCNIAGNFEDYLYDFYPEMLM